MVVVWPVGHEHANCPGRLAVCEPPPGGWCCALDQEAGALAGMVADGLV